MLHEPWMHASSAVDKIRGPCHLIAGSNPMLTRVSVSSKTFALSCSILDLFLTNLSIYLCLMFIEDLAFASELQKCLVRWVTRTYGTVPAKLWLCYFLELTRPKRPRRIYFSWGHMTHSISFGHRRQEGTPQGTTFEVVLALEWSERWGLMDSCTRFPLVRSSE